MRTISACCLSVSLKLSDEVMGGARSLHYYGLEQSTLEDQSVPLAGKMIGTCGKGVEYPLFSSRIEENQRTACVVAGLCPAKTGQRPVPHRDVCMALAAELKEVIFSALAFTCAIPPNSLT